MDSSCRSLEHGSSASRDCLAVRLERCLPGSSSTLLSPQPQLRGAAAASRSVLPLGAWWGFGPRGGFFRSVRGLQGFSSSLPAPWLCVLPGSLGVLLPAGRGAVCPWGRAELGAWVAGSGQPATPREGNGVTASSLCQQKGEIIAKYRSMGYVVVLLGVLHLRTHG